MEIGNFFKLRVCIFLILWTAAPPGNATVRGAGENGASFRIEFQDDGVVFFSEGATVGEILAGIGDEFRMTVSGLSEKQLQQVSATLKGDSVQDAMRRLLRQLGVRNFAFHYTEDRLSHVSVFPESKTPGPPVRQPPVSASSTRDSAVEVIDVVEGTQARTIGLEKGDLILEYGGIRLGRASQLVEETRNRDSFETVELAVLRNGERLRFFVNGGLIGVRVKTVRMRNELQ